MSSGICAIFFYFVSTQSSIIIFVVQRKNLRDTYKIVIVNILKAKNLITRATQGVKIQTTWAPHELQWNLCINPV